MTNIEEKEKRSDALDALMRSAQGKVVSNISQDLHDLLSLAERISITPQPTNKKAAKEKTTQQSYAIP